MGESESGDALEPHPRATWTPAQSELSERWGVDNKQNELPAIQSRSANEGQWQLSGSLNVHGHEARMSGLGSIPAVYPGFAKVSFPYSAVAGLTRHE